MEVMIKNSNASVLGRSGGARTESLGRIVITRAWQRCCARGRSALRGRCVRLPIGFVVRFMSGFYPEGTSENSPTFQRWEISPRDNRPEGTAESVRPTAAALDVTEWHSVRPQKGAEFSFCCRDRG